MDQTYDDATFSDTFPSEWQIVSASGGVITEPSPGITKISWDFGTAEGTLTKYYVLKSPQRTIPPTKYDFQASFSYAENTAYEDPYFVIVADPVAAPANEIELRVDKCIGQINQGDPDIWSDSCDGTYPSNACSAGNDLLDCDDNLFESMTTSNNGYTMGIWGHYRNSTITDCGGVQKVEFCYEWWKTTAGAVSSCKIEIDDMSFAYFPIAIWRTIDSTCPGSSANPGVTCLDITKNATWLCKYFFGSTTWNATARAQVWQSGSGSREVRWDVFHYNVTYQTDKCTTLTSSIKYEKDIDASTINTAGTCMNISTSGVTLDCNGNAIAGNYTSGFGINITDADDVVIKNCVIKNFSTGIYAANVKNLTLINNSFFNISNFGIYIVNATNSNLTKQHMADLYGINGRPPTDITGVYLQNYSNGSINGIYLYRLYAGNSTFTGSFGGEAVGFNFINSNNNSVSNLYAEGIYSGLSFSNKQSGNSTGIRLTKANNSVFRNITLISVFAVNSTKGSLAGADGKPGPFATGMDIAESGNSSFHNVTIKKVTGGKGGQGGNNECFPSCGNGGAGGSGGLAAMIRLGKSANNNFNNISLNNATGGIGEIGGKPGDASGSGGTGGAGGNAFGIFLEQGSYNNTFNLILMEKIYGGTGGQAGPAGSGNPGVGGYGGNSSFIMLDNANNNTFKDAHFNSSTGGENGSGVAALLPGVGFGLYASSSHWSKFDNIAFTNVSGGDGNATSYGNATSVYFYGSRNNEISNSTFDILYRNPLAFSVGSDNNAQDNVFINSSLNLSGNDWGPTGTNNITIKWYARANVTDYFGNVVSGASVTIFNVTSSTVSMASLTTDGEGLAPYIAITEFYANGSFTHAGYCIPETKVFCFNMHNFTAAATGKGSNYTSTNITATTTVSIILLPGPNVTLIFPANDTSYNPWVEMNFTCHVQDLWGIQSVDLYSDYLNGTWMSVQTNTTSGITDANYTFTANLSNWTDGGDAFSRSGTNYSETTQLSVSYNGSSWFLPSYNDNKVYELNETNWEVNNWAIPAESITDIAFNNTILAMTALSTDTLYLYDLDGTQLSSCSLQSLGGNSFYYGLDFDPDGTLWSVDYTNKVLWHTNTSCGNLTGAFPLSKNPERMAVSKGVAWIYNSWDNQIVAWNLSNGDVMANLSPRAIFGLPVHVASAPGINSNHRNKTFYELEFIYFPINSPVTMGIISRRLNGTFSWNCYGCNINGSCSFNNTNQTFDLAIPAIASTNTFTVFTLGAANTNFTTSIGSLPANHTEGYFFNTTDPYAQLVVPCANADAATDCQNGMAVPAYRVRNTGNSNITIWMNLSSSLSASNIQLCGNSSVSAGCPTTVVPNCDLTGEGNINASVWFKIADNLGQDSVCYEVNATIYGNFSGVAVANVVSRSLTINSTLT